MRFPIWTNRAWLVVDTPSWWPYYAECVSRMPDKGTTARPAECEEDGEDFANLLASSWDKRARIVVWPPRGARADCSLTDAHEH